MRTFSSEKERMQLVNEMIQDSMEMAEDEIDDSQVDNLISDMESDIKNKKQKNL